ncbi:hypothetical protein MAPG_01018 [Magnaporthiopsis poae ATCC 64411]|uniref:Tyrosine specific protein phosphatases domain-containing protein n=1 Tax=Magnaporthiopsis poae (strain ATCC 64411 / 73-15) TaxID=644358 RepID=A0A0C4DMK9_MAGP6|nr:hypothetical protein MAPG_01018 [Magnaporthiopsis poae ATCC 64411]
MPTEGDSSLVLGLGDAHRVSSRCHLNCLPPFDCILLLLVQIGQVAASTMVPVASPTGADCRDIKEESVQHLVPGISPAGPFVTRPPSPPCIAIPAIMSSNHFAIVPSYENVDPTMLGADDLRIITQNRAHMATDGTTNWDYDMRRKAQSILDFLYLGPWGVAKDRDFVKRERITMLLAVRDSRIAEIRGMSVERTAKELGIVADHVDVSSNQELIRVFPAVTRKINDHMLDIYRSQAAVPAPATASPAPASASAPASTSESALATTPADAVVAPGHIAIDKDRFRRGKVLVFCESGNNRSAAVVAAYIMTVFGVNIVRAVQFVNRQRFCTSFDEDTKFWLRAYQDILEARRAVAKHDRQVAAAPGPQLARDTPSKRSIQETYDETSDAEMGDSGPDSGLMASNNHDRERYIDREFFVPFIDDKDSEMT